MRMRSYKSGEEIIRYGQYGSEFFVVLSGRVSVRVPTTIQTDSKESLLELVIDNYDSVIWKSLDYIENAKWTVESMKIQREN